MTKKIRNEIWVLADNRPGTTSQAIGLAKELGLETKIIQLRYSSFVALPNFFLSHSLLRLAKSCRAEIENFDHSPSLVISAGRRSAPIALAIKKASNSQAKAIQIMNPNMPFKNFDLIILPKHDDISEAKHSNVVTTIGSLVSPPKSSESFSFDSEKIKIAVMIGGASKGGEFSIESAKKLAARISEIAKNMSAKLLVLNSRRTSQQLTESVESALECDFEFFDWCKIKGKNPYQTILNNADFFVITGDSVSMISEACSTGKPVYIFDEEKISSQKHRKFHQELYQKNYARRLVDTALTLENFLPNRLEETKRIASIVRKNLLRNDILSQ